MKTLLGLCLLLAPISVAAQQGTVTYDHTVVYGFVNQDGRGGPGAARGGRAEQGDSAQASRLVPGDSTRAGRAGAAARGRQAGGAPRGDAGRGPGGRAGGFAMPEGVPTNSHARMMLRFNATESVMSKMAEEEQARPADERAARLSGFAARMRSVSPFRSDQETLVGAYTNHADGTLVEAFEFMGRDFRISGPRPEFEWRLVGEQSEFLGYMVQKAETDHNGSTVEAWFTPQIPVTAGPGQFGGLPGLILVLSVDRGAELYSATAIDLGELSGEAIAPPKKGDAMSREAYEKIVNEKLKEIETTRGRRGRG